MFTLIMSKEVMIFIKQIVLPVIPNLCSLITRTGISGLKVDPNLKDYGRLIVTGKKEDSLKFKVPSLRNVSITYPYMHDGRYKSLKACIEHYGNNIQQSSTLDPSLTNGIHFNSNEIIDLVAFLRALTDSTLTKDLRFYQTH